MSVLILLIIISLLVAIGFLLAFLWSVRSGQYEDDYTPASRILFDSKPSKSKTNKNKSQDYASRKV